MVPENLSGTEEQFVPARLLYGLLPQALLDTYHFWQDDDDNLRGYHKTEKRTCDHYIYVELDPPEQFDHLAVTGALSAGCRGRGDGRQVLWTPYCGAAGAPPPPPPPPAERSSSSFGCR